MADPTTRFLTNDPLTEMGTGLSLLSFLRWSFNSIVGSDANAVVQMKKELAKGEGDGLLLVSVCPDWRRCCLVLTAEGNEKSVCALGTSSVVWKN